MHIKLSKSPITYVLAQVKFTNIESIEKYVPQLQEDIRREFPFFNRIDIQAIQIKPNAEPVTSTVTQWHFMDKESTTGILLDSSSLTIHTSKYNNFLDLVKQFKHILTVFNKRLEFSLYIRLGLRYINVIKSNLTEYVKPQLLGFHLEESNNFYGDQFLARTETTQVSKLGIIKIQSARIGNKKVIGDIKNYLVPPELVQTAEYLSFTHQEQPDSQYLILDIDHFQEKKEKSEFEVDNIIEEMHRLEDAIYEVFQAAITNKALEDWK